MDSTSEAYDIVTENHPSDDSTEAAGFFTVFENGPGNLHDLNFNRIAGMLALSRYAEGDLCEGLRAFLRDAHAQAHARGDSHNAARSALTIARIDLDEIKSGRPQPDPEDDWVMPSKERRGELLDEAAHWQVQAWLDVLAGLNPRASTPTGWTLPDEYDVCGFRTRLKAVATEAGVLEKVKRFL